MMKSRKKVVFLCSRVPYPPIGGEFQKTLRVLEVLNKKYDVTLVCLSHNPKNSEAARMLNKKCKELKILRLGKIHSFLNLFRFPLKLKPAQVGYFYDNNINKKIHEIVRNSDFIYCNLIRCTEYVKDMKIPKILDMADQLSQNYKSRARYEKNILTKLVYHLESMLLRRYESEMVKVFDIVTLFNYKEVTEFDDNRVSLVAHGVREEYLKKPLPVQTATSTKILFFGKMDYRPNIEAVHWFATNVLPDLPPEMSFCIAGSSPHPTLYRLAESSGRINILGYVPDMGDLIQKSLCVVAPIQFGSGIQNKVLESMALGCVTVASTKAVEAMQTANISDYLVVADSPSDIKEAILDIHERPDEYLCMRQRAREFVATNYTWSLHEKQVSSYCDKVLLKGG